MNKASLKEMMIIYAKSKNSAFNGGEFERLALDNGFKASNASRRAREMVKAGVLERIGGKSVSYRWIPNASHYSSLPPAFDIQQKQSNASRLWYN